MRRKLLALAIALASTFAAPAFAAGNINVTIFNDYSEGGGDISFSNPVTSFTSSNIDFEDPWWPNGDNNSFGAELTGYFNVAVAGTYSMILGSDDASYLFVNGAAEGSLPGDHGYITTTFDVNLNAGLNPFRIAFFNSFCCGSRLTLEPGDVGYAAAIPEPDTWAMLASGGLGLAGAAAWRRRQRKALAG